MKRTGLIIGILWGIIADLIIKEVIGYHWTMIIPIIMGIVLGSGSDNLENKEW